MRIDMHGLKAYDRVVDLAKLNLIMGPVGSGKSEVSEALRFLALGYVPSLGKAETATARLMRDSEIGVELRIDNDRTIVRRLLRDGSKLRNEARASWLPPKSKDGEHAEAIRQLFGASDQEAAEHLDLRTLLACSAGERARRIEQLLDASAMPPEIVARRGAALTLLRVASVEPRLIPPEVDLAEKVAAGCVSLIPAGILPVVEGVVATLKGHLTLEGIAKTAEFVKEQKLNAAEDVRRKVAARGEIEDRKIAAERPAEALADLEARKAAAVEALTRANQDLDTHAKVSTKKANAESALKAIRDQEEVNVRSLELAQGRLPEAAALRAKAEAIQDPPEVLAPPAVEPDAAKVAESEQIQAQAASIEEQIATMVVPAVIDTSAEAKDVLDAAKKIELAEQNPWREVEDIAARIEKALTGLPGGLRIDQDERLFETTRLRELAKLHGGDVAELRLELERRQARLREQGELSGERSSLIQATKANLERLRASAKELRDRGLRLRNVAMGDAADANRAARLAYTAAMGDRAVIVDRNARQRRELIEQATRLERDPVAQQMALDKLRGSIKEQEGILAGLETVAIDLGAVTKIVADSKALIEDLDAKIKGARLAAARREEMQALLNEIARATALRDAYAAAQWACERLREEDLAARSKGLEALMRTFLRAAGRQEDPYLRAARGVCEFGWRRGDYEIAVEALSGGETVLFCAALAAAVISLRAPAMRFLLIEAAELGAGETAQAVLKGCEAVAEGFDLIVVATCAQVEQPPNWNVVAVTKETAEVAA